MIPHKCSAYCEPDEGLHCVPMMGNETVTLEIAREHFQRFGNAVEVDKVLRDHDVTPNIVDRGCSVGTNQPTIWRRHRLPEHTIGYLVWLRDKEPKDDTK